MYRHFTLKEVYEYAERLGYACEDVEVYKVCTEYDYELEQEVDWQYEVYFGHRYDEEWLWVFDDLDQPARDYIHSFGED